MRELDAAPLKLAFGSPALSQSAIGRVSAAVIEELIARGHEVDWIRLERDQSLADELHPTRAHFRNWRDLGAQQLIEYDQIIVNLGDHFPFHAGAFHLMAHMPVLGVFHDVFLFNLFRGWSVIQDGEDPFDREIIATYGARTLAQIRSGEIDVNDLSVLAARLPMTEWLARRCAGALAHSPFYVERLEASCPGPVAMARLPWPARGIAPPPSREGDDVRVLTIGVVNPNKCVEDVIHAIASDEGLRRRVIYDVAGPVDEDVRKRLATLAGTLGVHVNLLGAVSDSVLEHCIEAADIISCLRRPVLEGASASLIEGLLSARPVVVCDAGAYSDVPDGACVKVPEAFALEDLSAALKSVCESASRRMKIGASGAAFAHRAYALGPYVDTLEELIRATIIAGPKLQAAARLGQKLAALGLSPYDRSTERLANSLRALNGGKARRIRTD
jgi:glycosyltransferase involved in cell wall biosynthesis